MWEAAPIRRGLRVAAPVALAIISLGLVSASFAADRSTGSPPEKIWGVQVGPKSIRLLNTANMLRLTHSGVNSLILRTGMNVRQVRKVRAIGHKWGLDVISPFAEPRIKAAKTRSTAEALAARCQQAKQAGTISYCAVRAASLKSALGLSTQGDIDLVLVNVRGPGQLARLQVSGATSRILAVTPLRGGRAYSTRAWLDAIRLANGTSSLELVAAPSGRRGSSALTSFATSLQRGVLAGMFPPDAVPPNAPVLKIAGVTPNSLTFTWQGAKSHPGQYILYRDGSYLARTAFAWATYAGLQCGTAHRITVEAVGRGGIRSLQSTLDATTAACSAGVGGPTSNGPSQPQAVGRYYAGGAGRRIGRLWRPAGPASDHSSSPGHPSATSTAVALAQPWTAAADPHVASCSTDDACSRRCLGRGKRVRLKSLHASCPMPDVRPRL